MPYTSHKRELGCRTRSFSSSRGLETYIQKKSSKQDNFCANYPPPLLLLPFVVSIAIFITFSISFFIYLLPGAIPFRCALYSAPVSIAFAGPLITSIVYALLSLHLPWKDSSTRYSRIKITFYVSERLPPLCQLTIITVSLISLQKFVDNSSSNLEQISGVSRAKGSVGSPAFVLWILE